MPELLNHLGHSFSLVSLLVKGIGTGERLNNYAQQ